MDEGRRLGYLAAMGIRVWVPRQAEGEPSGDGSTMVGAAHLEGPVDPASRVVPIPASPSPSPREASGLRADPARTAAQAGALSLAPDPARRESVPEGPARLDWDALQSAVSGCRACVLCETRTQTVFGVGCRDADLLIIGEAPGADEDRRGEPFVGRAGQLLNRMLAAIGLAREQVFIANVLKCRPPGNRDPRGDELTACGGYLSRQIELIQPRLILCVGRIAAQSLLGTEESLGRLRGRWFALGPDGVPLRVTYHPAYLLRSPEQKSKAWDDLLAVAERLRAGSGEDRFSK
jgi:DNA polymerase